MQARSMPMRTQPRARWLTAFVLLMLTAAARATVYEFTKTDHSFSFEIRRPVPNSENFVRLSTGEHHHLAIDDQGHVWSWGLNSSGQLGVTGIASSTDPVQIPGLEGVVQISAGGAHSLALTASGVVYAWGNNAHGQLGVSTPTKRSTPAPLTTDVGLLTGVVQVVAGEASTHLVRQDGTLWACGSNQYYVTLPFERVDNVWVPTHVAAVDNVRAFGVGRGNAAVLHRDGTVTRWTNQFLPDVIMPPLSDFVVGSGQIFGVGLDRRIYAWGAAENGALGLGLWKGEVAAPMPIPGLEGVVQVVSSGANSAAIDGNGVLYGWGGAPLFGNFGNQFPRRRPTPVVGIRDVRAVSTGRLLAIAIGTPSQTVTGLTFSPPTITSLDSTVGTVRLAEPVGAEGADLQIKVGTSEYVRNLTSIHVAPNTQEASFPYQPKHFAGELNRIFIGAGSGETFVGNFLQVIGCHIERVELQPARIIGGESAWAVVTSNLPAPFDGAVFNLEPLTPTDHNYFKEAIYGTISGGRTTGGTVVMTKTVNEPRTVRLVSSTNHAVGATLTILPPPPVRLRFVPETAMASTTVNGELEIQGTAPAGGLPITLASSDPRVTVPAQVTVPEGSSRVDFEVTVGAVRKMTSVSIAAKGAGGESSGVLVVNPPSVKSLSIEPNPLAGGSYAVLTVRIATPGPVGGCIVDLTSSDPASLHVPASVTVLEGQTEASIPVSPARVASFRSVLVSAQTARNRLTTRAMVRPARFVKLTASKTYAGSEGFGVTAYFDGRPADGTLIKSKVDNPIAKMRYADTIEYQGEYMGTRVSNSVQADLDPPEENVTVSVTALGTTRQVTRKLEGVHLKQIVAPHFGQKSGATILATIQLTSRTGHGGLAVHLSATGGASVPDSVTFGYYAIERGVYVQLPTVTKPTYITLQAAARGIVRTRKILVVP